MGIRVTFYLGIDLLVYCRYILFAYEIISEATDVHILASEFLRSQSQVHSNMIASISKSRTRAHICKEPNLCLWHRKYCILSCYLERCKVAYSKSATHDNPIPVSNFKRFRQSKLIIKCKLLFEVLLPLL
jgi:hypothetical protein